MSTYNRDATDDPLEQIALAILGDRPTTLSAAIQTAGKVMDIIADYDETDESVGGTPTAVNKSKVWDNIKKITPEELDDMLRNRKAVIVGPETGRGH